MRISEQLDNFYEHVNAFIFTTYSHRISDHDLLNSILRYQKNIVVRCSDSAPKELELDYDIDKYFNDLRAGNASALKKECRKYAAQPTKIYNNGKISFSREVVWYGRKGGKFFNNITRLE